SRSCCSMTPASSFARSSAVGLLLFERFLCGFGNEVGDLFRLLQHGYVARWEFNRFSTGLLRTCPFHRGPECAVLRRDHVPRRLRLPGSMRQFFVEHGAVDLALYRQDKPALGHRQTFCKTVENSLFGHPRETLRVDLNGLHPWRVTERFARID